MSGEQQEYMRRLLKKVDGYINLFLAHPRVGKKSADALKSAVSTRGKMLRPQLVLLSGMCGNQFEERSERLCKVAAIVEIIHMASLVHDDIIDDAPSRRGKPSIQKKFGRGQAVFTGDFMMSRICYHLLHENLNDAGSILADAVQEMCLGEMGQDECRYREDVTVGDYMRNIHGKTAALFMASCKVGALEGGCDRKTSALLEQFGECLGIAFQLRDDLMDYTSSHQEMGKETHKDFREGIYTLPLLCVLKQKHAAAGLRPVLAANKEGTVTDEQIRQMERVVREQGGISMAKKQLEQYGRQAEQLLAGLPDDGTPAVLLREMLKRLGI